MKKSLSEINIGICIITILTTILSCTLVPCSWDVDLDLVEKNPKHEFLIGTYKPDEKTVKHITGFEHSPGAELHIKSDGTFEMRNTPKRTFDFKSNYNSNVDLVNAIGKWKTSFNKGTAELNVNVQFDSIKTDLTDFRTSWRIYEKDGKAIIFIIIGDPDECSAVRFKKTNE